MDTRAIEHYAQEMCHGTNVRLFITRDIVSMGYRFTLRCDFQGNTYQAEKHITELDLYPNNDIIRIVTEQMIREMNYRLGRAYQVGK